MIYSAENILVLVFWVSLFVVGYSYCFYPALLRIAAGRFGRSPLSSDSHVPSIGIVIPVYNEEKVIAEKLRNIFSVDYPADRLSIWIGSDCSSDRTDDVVQELGDPRVHLWRSPVRSGKACVLNRLIPMVDAEIVLLTDADILLDPASVRALARNFADPEVGGVGGMTLQRQRGKGIRTEETAYRGYEANLKALESSLHSTISAFGSFYAIRKRLFVPFHPHTYSNDDVIMPMNIIRQGYRMCFEPSAVSYEEVLPQIQKEFKRRVRIGAGNFQAFFWLLDFLNPARGWPWFCYVSHKVTRWFSPMFIALAAVCCGILSFSCNGPTIYSLLFIAGLISVMAGLLHAIIPLPLTHRIYYFMAMNLAIIIGFFNFLSGIRSAAWPRTERHV
jgi:cellulose synthase/poly-beta-1,6-N-acetylglucosamine synthase-like glycosyltransferase